MICVLDLSCLALQWRWGGSHAHSTKLESHMDLAVLTRQARWMQAYEGLQTAEHLRQEYLLVPAKVKDVYLAHLLQQLTDLAVRSAIVFCSTCVALAQSPKKGPLRVVYVECSTGAEGHLFAVPVTSSADNLCRFVCTVRC